MSALPSGTGLSSLRDEAAKASSPKASIPSAGEVRAWLVAMTKQGEDRIWRGAEKALRFFDATIEPDAERWCWVHADPESTHASPLEWCEYVAPDLRTPFVERFEWGVAAPSTWVVFSDGEDGWPVAIEFRTEAAAEAHCLSLTQAADAPQ